MNADIIERIILEWIGSNYGTQEAEDPCYDIGTLAGHLYEKLQKTGYMEPQYESCPNCGTTDTEPPKGYNGDEEWCEWYCNVCGNLFMPSQNND